MDTSPQQPLENQVKSSWFSLISSPSEFFRTRRTRVPWLLPLIIISIVTGIMTIVQVPYLEKMPQFQRSLQQATANGTSEAMVKSIAEITSAIGGFLSPWITVLLGALVLWIIVKLFGLQLSYRNTLGILSNAHIVTALQTVVIGIVTVATGAMTKGFLSLNMFAHATGRTGTLLEALSIFWLWILYLTIVGVAEVTGCSKAKASAPVLIVTILGLLLVLAGVSAGAAAGVK
jgi:hypothetical protein